MVEKVNPGNIHILEAFAAGFGQAKSCSVMTDGSDNLSLWVEGKITCSKGRMILYTCMLPQCCLIVDLSYLYFFKDMSLKWALKTV